MGFCGSYRGRRGEKGSRTIELTFLSAQTSSSNRLFFKTRTRALRTPILMVETFNATKIAHLIIR